MRTRIDFPLTMMLFLHKKTTPVDPNSSKSPAVTSAKYAIMRVCDFMIPKRDVISCKPDDTLATVGALFLKYKISCVVES